MRTTISFAAATLADALAFGSSADDDAPEPIGAGAGVAPSLAARSSTAAPGADAAELTRLLPEVGAGFELTPDTAEKGAAARHPRGALRDGPGLGRGRRLVGRGPGQDRRRHRQGRVDAQDAPAR